MSLALGCLAAAAPGDAAWTRFRGPNGRGTAETSTIPAAWTDRDYRWKVELPGIGFSSPVVWEEWVYLTSALEDQSELVILCLKTSDGSVVWKQQAKCKPHPKYPVACDASTTPALDEERIYVVWATTSEHVALALDRRQGREIWRRDLGPFVSEDGFGASPVLSGDVLVLANDQDPGGISSLVALDRQTGQTRWKVERQSKKASFSTPCLFEPQGGRPQLIVTSCAHGMTSLDPATGTTNWELDAFELRTAGSPLTVSGLVFASNGSGSVGKYLAAVRAGIPEQGVRPEILYQIKQAVPYVPTPVVKWPLVFLWSDAGAVTCLDGPTGKVYWCERIGGEYLGSPVRAGGQLYCISRSGEMVVLAAATRFELLGRIKLGERSNSTPAIAGGVMYLRTVSHLMALGGK